LFFAWAQFDTAEVSFWRRLRDGLAGRGLRLVLATGDAAPEGLAVDHIQVPRRLDATWPCGSPGVGGLTPEAIGLDEAALLRRESDWGEPGIVPDVEEQRRQALGHLAGFWLSTLALLRPVVVVIWNGQHVPEQVLEALARRGGCPVLFAERAPVPRALFIDEQGLSAASAVAARHSWALDDPYRSRATADRVNERVAAGGLTWWEQPARRRHGVDVRTRLGVRPGQLVLLFAGQVDEDTQQFLFSPHFPGNLEAFRWWLAQLRGRPDVVVLGKHHPRSSISPEAYRQALATSGVQGAWVDDVAIDEALEACDRVAAVNSTVLYEAMARRIPALVLGRWLVGGRGVAYEVDALADGPGIVDRWLRNDDGAMQVTRWRDALAYLIERAIFAYEPAPMTGGMRDDEALARRLQSQAAGGDGWQAPPALIDAALRAPQDRAVPWWMPWDPEWPAQLHARLTSHAAEWQRWQWMREAVKRGRQAAREGRRLVVWGTGEAGRHAARLLRGTGVEPDVFGSSTAGGGVTCEGRDVIGPDGLRLGLDGPRDYVLIATAGHVEVAAHLEGLGLTRPRDYDTFEIDDLLAAARRSDEACPTAVAAGGDRRKDNW
jgi:hypothetical protein